VNKKTPNEKEIRQFYRSILSDFRNVDAAFPTQKKLIEEGRKVLEKSIELTSLERQRQSARQKDSELKRIRVEEETFVNSVIHCFDDFWNVDAAFSTQKKRIEEGRRILDESIENEIVSHQHRLTNQETDELTEIRNEEKSLINATEKLKNKILMRIDITKRMLVSAGLGRLLNLNDKKNLKLDRQSISLTRLSQLVPIVEDAARELEQEIHRYKQWHITHKRSKMRLVVAFILVVLTTILLYLVKL
jgi:hypothetical protein